MDAEHLVLRVAFQHVWWHLLVGGAYGPLLFSSRGVWVRACVVAPSFRTASRRGLVLAQLERPVLCVSV